MIAGATPSLRLASLVSAAPGRMIFTTSFGIEDQALTHLIATARLPIDIVTLDTGRLFPETYALWQATEEQYAVRIRSFHPDAEALATLVADAGINGFYFSKSARRSCCFARKVEPLRRALAGADVWVTGLRADQSTERERTLLSIWDSELGLLKVNPLFDLSRDEVMAFCLEQCVPINALHASGFTSIGCQPCTRAVAPGDTERAGRWWWEQSDVRECGLHVRSDGLLAKAKAAA